MATALGELPYKHMIPCFKLLGMLNAPGSFNFSYMLGQGQGNVSKYHRSSYELAVNSDVNYTQAPPHSHPLW